MAIFLTSDTHFWHNNIIEYCSRPFDSVEEMNETIIKNWNNVVKPEDTVYHLGDISFAGYPRTESVVSRLNGDIIVCKGNHDRAKVLKKLKEEGHIKEWYNIGFTIKLNKNTLWLSHYPMEIGVRHKKFSVSGHIHEELNTYINQINVGVDSPLIIIRQKAFGEPLNINELEKYINSLNDSGFIEYIINEDSYSKRESATRMWQVSNCKWNK